MYNLWSFLLQTGTASLTAVLILAVRALLRGAMPPRWQCALWGVLMARLILPAGLGGRYLLSQGPLALELLKSWVEEGLGSALTDPWAVTRVALPIPLLTALPASPTDWVFWIYAAGVLAVGGWFLAGYCRLRLALGRAQPAGAERMEQIRLVAGQYHLKSCRTVEVPGLGSPFVCGPLRPVLALPQGEPVDDKLLLHELLHLGRGDVWVGVLLCVLRCLHWCNPLIWLCLNRAQNDWEALCDQRVLERLDGEARRDYGYLLLSMASGRYAGVPGTSSMAKGGRSIRDRISSIARFRRFPTGTALAARCGAAVLAAACLVGVQPQLQAAEDLYQQPLSTALAYARLCRAATVAGALDTYARALLWDNGIYLAMVTPLEDHPALAARLSAESRFSLGLSSPFDQDFQWVDHQGDIGIRSGAPVRQYQADWGVFNLAGDGAGGYTGLLVFRDPWSEASPVLGQQVRVYPDGGWAVEALSPLGPLADGLTWDPLRYGAPDLPALRYTGEDGAYRVELECQYILLTGQSPAAQLPVQALTPVPDASFTTLNTAYGGQVIDLSSGRSVSRMVSLSTPGGEADGYICQQDTIALPRAMEQGSGQGGAALSRWCAPPALDAVLTDSTGVRRTLRLCLEGERP